MVKPSPLDKDATSKIAWARYRRLMRGMALVSLLAVVGALGIRAQLVFGDRVPHDLLLGLPYIATVFGVWLSARLRGGARSATGGFGELRDS